MKQVLVVLGKVWKPRFPSPPPLGGKNHATSYHLFKCLLGQPTESGVSIPYVQPYDFFPIVKTLALHGAKFIPDVETHSIHPTVKSLD